MSNDVELSTSLATSPLLWLTVTLCVWLASERIAIAAGRHAFANPLLISVIAIATLLRATGTSYATYFAGAQFIQFLIGPAVVAIAVPLFKNWSIVKQNVVPILTALFVGCITAIVASVLMARALRLPDVITMSLATKSATTCAAMAIGKSIGGEPAMTATFTVTTSIVAAATLVSLMRVLRVRDAAAIGFAAGLTAHSVGTARAFQVDPIAGTLAGIALCLNAILTALIVPVLLAVLR